MAWKILSLEEVVYTNRLQTCEPHEIVTDNSTFPWRKPPQWCNKNLLILSVGFRLAWQIFCCQKQTFLLNQSKSKSVLSLFSFHSLINALVNFWACSETGTQVSSVDPAWLSRSRKITFELNQQSESYSFLLIFVAGDFHDSYGNFTMKVVFMMQWLGTYCPGVRFMLKIDDDVLLNLPVVQGAVTTSVLRRNMMGMWVSTPSVVQNTTETLVGNSCHLLWSLMSHAPH